MHLAAPDDETTARRVFQEVAEYNARDAARLPNALTAAFTARWANGQPSGISARNTE